METVATTTCLRCEATNAGRARFCRECNRPLDEPNPLPWEWRRILWGFDGRVRRIEWWSVQVAFVWGLAMAAAMDGFVGMDPTYDFGFSGFALLIAAAVNTSASVGRLHDMGLRGWWLVLAWVPFIGIFVELGIALGKTADGANRWGPAVGSWGRKGGGLLIAALLIAGFVLFLASLASTL